MNLQQLFRFFSFSYEKIDPLTIVTGLFLDSRKVQKDSVFFAIKGHNRDGHDSIPEAIEKGAIAIVCSDAQKIPASYQGIVLQVQDVRVLLASLSARFFEVPSQSLFAIGVTGTNGKTSVTYLIEHLLNLAQKPTAVMGTINHHLGDQVWSTDMTTPNSIELQSRLNDFKNAGAKAVVMEVSSHALDQKRADGVSFDVGVFTNLTRDHLDYHSNMQTYLEAKQRLFTDLMWKTSKAPCYAIVNTDDSFGRRIKVAETAEIWTYGQDRDSDFCFRIKSYDWQGTTFELKTQDDKLEIQVPLLGQHNIYNSVAALAAVQAAGVNLSEAAKHLQTFKGIPGRLQKVMSDRVHIFVDYAHTPDALEKALFILKALRNQLSPSSKIWCVFGCGGDRDKGKRPLMAQSAYKFADRVVVTSDNPRTENPEMILNDIDAGFSPEQKIKRTREPDRRKAIYSVISQAKPGDVILIAGKGHENYQIIGTEKTDFDDYRIATEIEKGFS